MMNVEKHKKKAFQERLEEDRSLVPTRSRGSHILTRYIKIPKQISQKPRQNFLHQETLKDKALPRGEPRLHVRFREKQVLAARQMSRPSQAQKLRATFKVHTNPLRSPRWSRETRRVGPSRRSRRSIFQLDLGKGHTKW